MGVPPSIAEKRKKKEREKKERKKSERRKKYKFMKLPTRRRGETGELFRNEGSRVATTKWNEARSHYEGRSSRAPRRKLFSELRGDDSRNRLL